MRPVELDLTTEIADEIARRISRYGPGPGDQIVEASTKLAITQAVDYFIEHVRNPAASRQALDDTLRRIGRGEAYNGRSLDALREAFSIGTSLAWRRIHSMASREGLDAGTLGDLGDELFDFMDSLAVQSAVGWHEAQAQLSDATQQWRARLLELILGGSGGDDAELLGLAATGNWRVPTEVVMVAVGPDPARPLPAGRMLHPSTLALLHNDSPIVLVPAPVTDLIAAELRTLFDGHRLTLGCAVPLAEARTSLRWARRMLELAAAGVVPDEPVIDCARHIGTLWVHSEPMLADIVNRTSLAPLFAEPPNSRRILGETLLIWVETMRGSSPLIAELLGKHPQTIRYRLRRLREILGDALDDPNATLEMYYALRASGPQWNNGKPAPQPVTGLPDMGSIPND